MITRRPLRLGIALLLPLMALRALLPAGFMPVPDSGGFALVMCSAGLASTAGDPATSDDDHPRDPGTGLCAFALAASTVPPPTQHTIALVDPLRESRGFQREPDLFPPATGPPRTAAARAPPALS